jgi:hypothetical protein
MGQVETVMDDLGRGRDFHLIRPLRLQGFDLVQRDVIDDVDLARR